MDATIFRRPECTDLRIRERHRQAVSVLESRDRALLKEYGVEVGVGVQRDNPELLIYVVVGQAEFVLDNA